MFLLEATQKLDFGAVKGVSDGPWVIACLVGISILVFTIFMWFAGEDGVIVLFGLFIGLGAFALIMFIGSSSTESYTAEQKTDLQSWASDTYLIDLNDRQANDLLENQVNLKTSEPGDTNDNAVTTKNSYDEIISVTLVKDNKNYVLVQSNSELPPATKGK